MEPVSHEAAAGGGQDVRPPLIAVLRRDLRHVATLTKAEIEIVTNLTTGRWRTPYANYEHEKIGVEKGGLAPQTVEALISGHPASFDDPRQQVVYELASTLVVPRFVPLGLYRRAHTLLGDAGIVDVTVLIAWFTAVSMTLAAYDVPADAVGLDQ
jgi:4-carboxymuconolactone decarboxylase